MGKKEKKRKTPKSYNIFDETVDTIDEIQEKFGFRSKSEAIDKMAKDYKEGGSIVFIDGDYKWVAKIFKDSKKILERIDFCKKWKLTEDCGEYYINATDEDMYKQLYIQGIGSTWKEFKIKNDFKIQAEILLILKEQYDSYEKSKRDTIEAEVRLKAGRKRWERLYDSLFDRHYLELMAEGKTDILGNKSVVMMDFAKERLVLLNKIDVRKRKDAQENKVFKKVGIESKGFSTEEDLDEMFAEINEEIEKNK